MDTYAVSHFRFSIDRQCDVAETYCSRQSYLKGRASMTPKTTLALFTAILLVVNGRSLVTAEVSPGAKDKSLQRALASSERDQKKADKDLAEAKKKHSESMAKINAKRIKAYEAAMKRATKKGDIRTATALLKVVDALKKGGFATKHRGIVESEWVSRTSRNNRWQITELARQRLEKTKEGLAITSTALSGAYLVHSTVFRGDFEIRARLKFHQQKTSKISFGLWQDAGQEKFPINLGNIVFTTQDKTLNLVIRRKKSKIVCLLNDKVLKPRFANTDENVEGNFFISLPDESQGKVTFYSFDFLESK